MMRPESKFKKGDKVIAYDLHGVIYSIYYNQTPDSPGFGKWWYEIDFDNGSGGMPEECDVEPEVKP